MFNPHPPLFCCSPFVVQRIKFLTIRTTGLSIHSWTDQVIVFISPMERFLINYCSTDIQPRRERWWTVNSKTTITILPKKKKKVTEKGKKGKKTKKNKKKGKSKKEMEYGAGGYFNLPLADTMITCPELSSWDDAVRLNASLSGFSEFNRTEVMRRLKYYSYGITLPAICFLGIVGNILNLVVLTRPTMRGPAYVYMRGILITILFMFKVEFSIQIFWKLKLISSSNWEKKSLIASLNNSIIYDGLSRLLDNILLQKSIW